MKLCCIENCTKERVHNARNKWCREHYNEFKRAEYHVIKHRPEVRARINPVKGSARWIRKQFISLKNYDIRHAYISPFDFTFEEYQLLIRKACFYCEDQAQLVGLDRIDNNIGHSKSNVVPCCTVCNRTRNNNFSHEEFIEIGKVIKSLKARRSE